ncbi:MAG: 2-isopropylmalate synthase [Deltaproteobacteria bacterium]|nr:2-isopropylmalate synthase [Deltaproteobacteria bacterium]
MPADFVKIFDTTLRDGEQSPGYSMDINEKLTMAHQLARLGVDVIEAGFPIASPGDFESVRRIASEVEGPSICGLARAQTADIERCWEAVKPSRKPRIHVFIATSDIHLKYKLRKDREQVLKDAVQAIRLAKSFTEDVEFSAEDATRSDPTYLAEILSAVVEAGAMTLNIPDTVGYTIPSEYSKLIRYLKEHVQGADHVVLSAHCHNDLGLAVANSLAGIESGIRQVECTINGIGERAGNASLEEIVMALKVRQEKLGLTTRIQTEQLYPSSRLLAHITGIGVQPNKAIVGANAFAHESGIHQDGLLKSELTYSIMTPDQVGVTAHQYVLGKHSGRHAFREKLKALNYQLTDAQFEEVFKKMKELADKKKRVFDEDIEMIVMDLLGHGPERYILEDLKIQSGTRLTPKAVVTLKINGKKVRTESKGDGPVDAAFSAIKKLTKFKGNLQKFSINAITGGTDAQGEVTVALEYDGRTVRGVGSHTDIVVASVKAFLAALNRTESTTDRVHPQKGV